MGYSFRQRSLRSAAVAGLMLMAGCGGSGGGVNSTPTPPAPTPTPAPAPAPTPTPTASPTPTPTPTASGSYDTAEYRATVGAVSLNALAAYNRGATGLGVGVGIVDSGLDVASEEFGNRISPASASTAGNASIDDEGGHGTAVAFTIAGRRNGAGTHGVAFDATLVIARADTPGSCANVTTDVDSGCSFGSTAIARGIDLAVTNGARVVNLSLGGSAPGSSVVAAVNRATAAGVIIVISAGNDFNNADAAKAAAAVNPDPFAEIANNSAVSRNLVIIAGSVGASDGISSFSNRAGDGAAHYLAAVGERVRAPCNDTQVCLWSGTSFSAPQIAGAVALLAQAFPSLTGAQIVDILFSSAREAGAAGTDTTYGRGILDLTRAFQPIGTTSVAGSTGTVSLLGNGTLSAPMGDARQGQLGTVILDGYSRAFAIDLARTLDRSRPSGNLVGLLQSRTRNVSAAVKGMTIAVTLAPVRGGVSVERTLLQPDDYRAARAIAGVVTQRLGGSAQFALGFAEGGSALTAQLAGRAEPAFLVARDPVRGQGFDSRIKGSGAIRQQIGGFGVTAAIESGDVLSPLGEATTPRLRDRYERFGYDRSSLAVDRQFGGLNTGITATRLGERDTLLGAHFGSGLGATRATSWFLDAAARLDAGGGWSLGGSLRQGWTFADVRGGLSGGGLIRTSAFSADLGKQGVFGRRDSWGLRLAQPLRVATGGIDLNLPVGYDYGTGRVSAYETQRLNLAPTGRELDAEFRYGFPLLDGDFQTNLFWRRNPGNFADLPADRGAALRYSRGF